jgi:ATP-dependent helicase/nuclease subunit A
VSEASAELRARDAQVWERAQREFERPLVVEAGAGTGKTSLLVARCLAWTLGLGWVEAEKRLAGGGDDRIAAEVLSRVVALTFTEAAVAQMSRRMGEALAKIANGGLPDGVVPALLPEDHAVRSARANALLGALDRFQVRTIHAFCRRLLAQHALAAGLHPQLEVDADGLAARAVARELVDEAVRAGYAPPGDPDLLALAVEDCGPPRLEEALVALLEKGVGEDALTAEPFSPGRIRAWAADFRGRLDRFDEAARLLDRVSRSSVTRATLDAIAENARLLRSDPAGLEDLEATARAMQAVWEKNRLERLAKWAKDDFGKSEEDALGEGRRRAAAAAAGLHPAVAHAVKLAPLHHERLRRVLAQLLGRARDRMRARGAIGYADLLRGARDLLRDQPAVRSRVRAEIDQLLIDEFQDTDRMQCEILRWLALDGSAEERPGLFLVGDPKQSIYGWREADLRAYEGFVGEALGSGGEPARLSVNRRSTPEILAEVERAIAPVMGAAPGVQPAFQPLVPDEKRAAGAPDGGVEHFVSWLWNSDDGEHRRPSASGAAQLEAAAIAADLARLHREGRVAWKDAGLLLRATSDLETYLTALRDAGVPYAVERDRSYYLRREVIDATALVCCVLDPSDLLALITWLRSPAVGVPDAALLPLRARGLFWRVADLTGDDEARLAELGSQIEAAAKELPDGVPGLGEIAGWEHSLRHAVAVISALRASFADDAADVFVEKLRSLTLLEAGEASRYLGAYRVANLTCFFRDLRGALEEDDVDLQVLLRRLRGDVANEREREEPRPPDAGEDAVHVMSIHQSKGLEFRHCYLAQLHKQTPRNRNDDPVEIRERDGAAEYRLFETATLGFAAVKLEQAEIAAAEQVRSLYVAMTRACDRLVLLGDRSDAADAKDPALAATHAQLLESRSGERPDLPAEMARAQRDGSDGLAAEDGVRWIFPALRALVTRETDASAGGEGLPRAAELAAEAALLAGHRERAERRMRRQFRAAASADSHADARENLAERRFAGGEAWRAALVAGAETARAAGTAVHRVLEKLTLGGDLRDELARASEGLGAWIDAQAAGGQREAALASAREALARFADGPLLERFAALQDAVIARELPVLLPADRDGEGAVGFIAGSIDLLYRDPASGELVVVDYKTDRVEGNALLERAAHYAGQARHYRRAVRDALGLPAPPRFELWFLHAGAIMPVG